MIMVTTTITMDVQHHSLREDMCFQSLFQVLQSFSTWKRVPGERSNNRIKNHPDVASFFERMTYIPLEGITQMVPPGGAGVGMHVIPVEKAIEFNGKRSC